MRIHYNAEEIQMSEYRKATADDLESIWDMNISDNPDDDRWVNMEERIYFV